MTPPPTRLSKPKTLSTLCDSDNNVWKQLSVRLTCLLLKKQKRNDGCVYMPAEYKIGKILGIVFSAAHGIVTDKEAYSHQDKLRNDLGFDPGFPQLFDFTSVAQAELSIDAIHYLAERNPFGLGSKRAFVAPSDLMYGLSRMF